MVGRASDFEAKGSKFEPDINVRRSYISYAVMIGMRYLYSRSAVIILGSSVSVISRRFRQHYAVLVLHVPPAISCQAAI